MDIPRHVINPAHQQLLVVTVYPPRYDLGRLYIYIYWNSLTIPYTCVDDILHEHNVRPIDETPPLLFKKKIQRIAINRLYITL